MLRNGRVKKDKRNVLNKKNVCLPAGDFPLPAVLRPVSTVVLEAASAPLSSGFPFLVAPRFGGLFRFRTSLRRLRQEY